MIEAIDTDNQYRQSPQTLRGYFHRLAVNKSHKLLPQQGLHI